MEEDTKIGKLTLSDINVNYFDYLEIIITNGL